MKIRNRFLIASLFAGLSLGVLSGVNFASKNDTEPLQTDAGTTYYWREVTALSQIANGTEAIIASATAYNGSRYYLSSFTTSSAGKALATAASGVVTSADDFVILKTDAHPSPKYQVKELSGTTDTSTFKLQSQSDTSKYLNIYGDGHNGSKSRYYEVFGSSSGTDSNFQKFKINEYGNHYLTANGVYACYFGGSRFIGTYTSNMEFYSDFLYCKLYVAVPTNTVTLDNQSATTAGSTSSSVAYANAMPKITVPKRTGYTFGGYYTGKSGTGTQYYKADGTSAKNWDRVSNTTLYAKWTTNTYTVKYNGNGSTSGSTSDSSHTYGTAKNLTANGFKRTGYSFNGWATSADGDIVYKDQASVKNLTTTANGTVNLYAVWEPNVCLITFDKAGGDYGYDFDYVTYDSVMRTIQIPSKTGYTFGGYYSGQNGTGTQYYGSDGASVKIWDFVQDVTLYAKWTPNTYHVSLDSQGGTDGDTKVDTTFNEPVPSVTIPTKPGYTFKGYFSGLNGTGIQYIKADGTSTANPWTTAEDNTIYASWELNTYTLTYSNLQGTTTSNPTSYTVESNAIVLANPTERAGYTFEGWFDALNGGNQISSIAKGTTGNITLYAHWKTVDYSITYLNLFGSTHTNPTTYNVEASTFTLTSPSERAGYTFEGWFNAPEGGTQTTSIVKGSTGNPIFYAHWKAINYTITYENLQGSTQSNPTSYNIESETITLSNPTVRPGHTFVGWFDALEGGNKVTSIAKGSTGNVKVYAHWSDDSSYQPTCSNSLGGWITDTDGKQKQIVAFGFQFSGEIYPTNDNDFGIIAYRSLASGVEYAKGTVADLKANDGRFYMYLIIDEAEPVTCYARAFVKFNGEYIYSSLVSATGDLTGTEYVL